MEAAESGTFSRSWAPNNQHVVPSTPQPWPNSTLPAAGGRRARGCSGAPQGPRWKPASALPEDLNRMGYRTAKATYDLGPNAEKYTVRMGGCVSCPIRCHSHLTCRLSRRNTDSAGMPPAPASAGAGAAFSNPSPTVRAASQALKRPCRRTPCGDLGIWTNYSQLQRDFKYAYDQGLIKANLFRQRIPLDPLERFEKGDPGFLKEIYTRIAYKQGEFGAALGEGSGRLAERWKFPPEYYKEPGTSWWKMGTRSITPRKKRGRPES